VALLDFGRFSHDLLIGQFAGAGDTQSSGFIAAYDLATGKLDGLLQDASGKPLAVNGIWSLSSGVEIFGLIGVPGGIRTPVRRESNVT